MPILFLGKTDPCEIQCPLLTCTIKKKKKNIKNAGACSIYLDSVGCQVILMNTKILKIHLFVAKKNALVTSREKTIQHYQNLTNTKS